jgi:TonB-dependent SusC/RagA subfamily outer membrane receptor
MHPTGLTRRAAARWLAIALAMLGPVAASAQGIVVGTVTDATTKHALEGVRIQILGTTIGGMSDQRGHFMVRNAPVGPQRVQATRIGFRPSSQSVTIARGDSVTVVFSMDVSAVELSAIVTTGTGGEVDKKKVGTSMGTVDFTNRTAPSGDIGSALAAQVTGLRSQSVGGGAGAAKDLRIRGIASFSLTQRPVVYIDGVRVDKNGTEWTSAAGIGNKIACCAFAGGTSTDRLSDLNPDDVDHVEVLKGAAAATLYGSEATNGVIQIFTKKGRSDSKASWNVGVTSGYDRLRDNLPTTLYPNFSGPDGTRAKDSNKLIQSGVFQNLEMSVQGGGNRSTYFISGNYMDQEGSIQPNWQRRGSLRLNLAFLPNDQWTIETRSLFTKNKIAELQAGNNWTALLGNAMNGNPRAATALRPYGEAWVPVADIQQIQTYDDVNRWTGGVTINYTPRENFRHRLTVGLDAVNEQKSRFFPFYGDYGSAGVTNGQRNLAYRNYSTYTIDYLGTLNLKLPHKIESDFSFGGQGFLENERLNIAVGNSFAGPGVSTVSTASVTTGGESYAEAKNVGALVQERLSFGSTLFVTLGLRMDGNSAFGENFGFKKYPKADVSWVVSDYFTLPEFISSLRLRSAIGQAGKAPGTYAKFTTFAARSVFAGTPGVVPDNPGNDNLKPETTTETEAGFEAGFFKDRVGVEGSVYRATTKDAIVPKSNPPSAGFASAASVNIGAIQNDGWELSVKYLAISRGSMDWTTTVRMDGNKNKVTDLGGLVLAGNAVRKGYPVGGVWDRAPTGFSVVNGKPVTTRGDTAVFFGSPLPTFNASWGNSVRYRAFTLTAMITMERGAMFSNSDRPYRVRQGGSDEFLKWLTADGKSTFSSDSVLQYMSIINTIDSRDNVRFRELSLSWAVPQSLTVPRGLGLMSVTFSGLNLNWWDHCHCVDPNMNWAGGSDFNVANGFLAQPAPRSFRLTVRSRL